MNEHLVRQHLIFDGDCQGVGFRYNSQRIAMHLGLVGWVKNLYDGTVEMELQGTPEQIADFYGAIFKTYRMMHLNPRLKDSWDIKVQPDDARFDILY